MKAVGKLRRTGGGRLHRRCIGIVLLGMLLGVLLAVAGPTPGSFQARAQTAQSQLAPSQSAAPQGDAAARLAVFDEVWQTVRDRFYDKALHGLDWAEIRARYRPQAAAATDDAAR